MTESPDKSPYFNRYLKPLRDKQTGEITKKENAAAGCVNTAIGQIMYMYGYPNSSALSGYRLDTETSFPVTYAQSLIKYSFGKEKMMGGTASNSFYNWGIMQSQPKREFVPDRENFPVNPGRDEAARLIHDIGTALDPISASKIEEPVSELKKEYAVIIVTHNMHQAVRISERTAFFLIGEPVEYGDAGQVFSTPRDERCEDYITGRFG